MRVSFGSCGLALTLAICSIAPASAAPRAERTAAMSALLQQAHDEHKSAPVDELLGSIAREHDPLVRKFQLSALLRTPTPMTRPQKRALLSMVRDGDRGLLPRRPALPKTGPIEVRYNIGAEFFDDSVQALVDQGFTFHDAPGEGLQATRGRLHLLVDTGAHNLQRDLRDPNVHAIIYSGHSELGGVVEHAVRDGGLDQRGLKLVALLQCKGIQTLPLLASAMPNAQVLTTIDYSHSLSDQQFAHALLDGFERGDSYAQIRSRIVTERKAYVYAERGNYLFPDRAALLSHTDFDRDGQLDAEQRRGFANLSPAQRRGGARLLSAVHYLRTMNPYYAEELRDAVFSRAQAGTIVRAAGIEAGDGASVTHISERSEGDRKIVEVALDQKFATADGPFVAAASVYELQLHLQGSLLGERGERARARALAFAGEYLNRMFPGARGERALAQLTAMKALPSIALSALPSGVHALSESAVSTLAGKLAAR